MRSGALERAPPPRRLQRWHGAHAHTRRAEDGPERVERFGRASARELGGGVRARRRGWGRTATPESQRVPLCVAPRAATMAAYKLVLIRHGESAWNLENRFSGWYDADLSPAGHEEAKRGGQALRGEERTGAGCGWGLRRLGRAPLVEGRLARPRTLSERADLGLQLSCSLFCGWQNGFRVCVRGGGGLSTCSRSPSGVMGHAGKRTGGGRPATHCILHDTALAKFSHLLI